MDEPEVVFANSLTIDTSFPDTHHHVIKHLWPVPRFLELSGGELRLEKHLKIYIVEGQCPVDHILKVCEVHRERLCKAGYSFTFGGVIRSLHAHSELKALIIHVNNSQFPNPSEAYTLSINSSKMRLVAGDISGVYYGICILVQLLALSDDLSVPLISIMDWPTWKIRGTLLRLSQLDQHLTSEPVLKYVDFMAGIRLNELIVMMTISPGAETSLPFTHSELTTLESYCKDRHINLMPAFEFGSLSDYLPLDDFCEMLTVSLSYFSNVRYIYFGPNATNYFVNVLKTSSPFPHCPIPLQCCLILHMDSVVDADLLSNLEIPFCSIHLYHYDSIWNQSDVNNLKAFFSFARFPHGVMLPSSLKNSITGCSEFLHHTFYNVAHALLNTGSTVFLLSDVFDKTFPFGAFGLSGLTFGAGMAWNCDVNMSELGETFSNILDVHVFDCGNVGCKIISLSRAETELFGRLPQNESSFAYLLISQPDSVSLDGLSLERLQRSVRDIKECVVPHELFERNGEMVEWITEEIGLVADILLFACRLCRGLFHNGQNPWRTTGFCVANVGLSNLPATNRTDLANRILDFGRRIQNLCQGRLSPESFKKGADLLNDLLHHLIPHNNVNDVVIS